MEPNVSLSSSLQPLPMVSPENAHPLLEMLDHLMLEGQNREHAYQVALECIQVFPLDLMLKNARLMKVLALATKLAFVDLRLSFEAQLRKEEAPSILHLLLFLERVCDRFFSTAAIEAMDQLVEREPQIPTDALHHIYLDLEKCVDELLDFFKQVRFDVIPRDLVNVCVCLIQQFMLCSEKADELREAFILYVEPRC